jgi:hypothetical protein
VQLGLNEAINQRTGSAAFALMFGRKFNGFRDFSNVARNQNWEGAFADVQRTWTEFRDAVLPGIAQRTAQVKKRQEKRLNERPQAQELPAGTEVMVINHQKGSKWEPHYDGPYTVDHRHAGGAYTLRNALDEVLNERFTIEMLKPTGATSSESEAQELDDAESYEVAKVLDHRLVQPRGYEYLVKWKGYSDEDNSWVAATDFGTMKPIVQYWKRLKREQKRASSDGAQRKKPRTAVSGEHDASIGGSANLVDSTVGLGGSHVRLSDPTNASAPKRRSRRNPKVQLIRRVVDNSLLDDRISTKIAPLDAPRRVTSERTLAQAAHGGIGCAQRNEEVCAKSVRRNVAIVRHGASSQKLPPGVTSHRETLVDTSECLGAWA